MQNSDANKRISVYNESISYAINNAILIYKSNDKDRSSQRSSAYATFHSIDIVDGKPVIGAGVPITPNQVRDTFSDLIPNRKLTLLPENVISINQDKTVWWTNESKRPLHVNLTKNIIELHKLDILDKKGSHIMAYPPLIHIASRNAFSVFAFKENIRPTAKTELFHAPFLNIYENGSLCLGTTKLPLPDDPNLQEKCEQLLFDSWSTHPNFDDKKQTLHPEGMLSLMDKLICEKTNSYPIECLATTGMTLGDYLNYD